MDKIAREPVMFRKPHAFLFLIVLMGALDWLTTMASVLGFNAKEINPFLSAVTGPSLVLFSFVKLRAILVAGIAFHKASSMRFGAGSYSNFASKFLDSGFSISLVALTIVVVNNVAVMLRL